jgi:hypothetical protein
MITESLSLYRSTRRDRGAIAERLVRPVAPVRSHLTDETRRRGLQSVVSNVRRATGQAETRCRDRGAIAERLVRPVAPVRSHLTDETRRRGSAPLAGDRWLRWPDVAARSYGSDAHVMRSLASAARLAWFLATVDDARIPGATGAAPARLSSRALPSSSSTPGDRPRGDVRHPLRPRSPARRCRLIDTLDGSHGCRPRHCASGTVRMVWGETA